MSIYMFGMSTSVVVILGLVLHNHRILFCFESSELRELLHLDLLSVLLLQHEHVLCRSYLGRHISALNPRVHPAAAITILLLLAKGSCRCPVHHELAIGDDACFAVVVVLHLLVNVVFLADLGAQGVPQIVTPVRAQCLRMFVGGKHLMHCTSLLTVYKKNGNIRLEKSQVWGRLMRHLRLDSLVFVICELSPLVEPIKLKLAAIATSRFLKEVVFGPLILHALIARHWVVFFLWRDALDASLSCCGSAFNQRLCVGLILGRLGSLSSHLLGGARRENLVTWSCHLVTAKSEASIFVIA